MVSGSYLNQSYFTDNHHKLTGRIVLICIYIHDSPIVFSILTTDKYMCALISFMYSGICSIEYKLLMVVLQCE